MNMTEELPRRTWAARLRSIYRTRCNYHCLWHLTNVTEEMRRRTWASRVLQMLRNRACCGNGGVRSEKLLYACAYAISENVRDTVKKNGHRSERFSCG